MSACGDPPQVAEAGHAGIVVEQFELLVVPEFEVMIGEITTLLDGVLEVLLAVSGRPEVRSGRRGGDGRHSWP